MNYNDKHDFVLENQTFNGQLIKFNRGKNITIKNCKFEDCSVVFINCQDVKVSNNNFVDCLFKHAVQFNQCLGGKILNNYFSEQLGHSKLSDIINIYQSNGTVVAPILIKGNYIIGGGPSTTGGGIIIGDNMGDNQVIENNICIDCGQYGIAISGGANNKIINNTIMGAKQPWTNVGIYVYGIPQRGSIVKDSLVEGNTVSWVNKKGVKNGWWVGANVNHNTLRGNNFNAEYRVIPKPAGVGC